MKILIADADLITRTLVERSLVQAGYDVAAAASAAETELTLVGDPDITTLIMDGRASVGFGPALCQQIRQRLGDRPLFVVMMCKREEVDPRKAFDSGANEIVGKPVNVDELLSRVALGERLMEAESSLWATRAYLAAIMDNLDVGVIITAADGRVVQANEALARVGGVAPEDIIGRDRSRVMTHWQRHTEPAAGFVPGRTDVDLPGRQRRVLRVTNANLSLPWGQVRLELCQDASKEVLYDELVEKSACLDPITGVLDRNGISGALSRAAERARRHGEALSVAGVRVTGLPQADEPLAPAVRERCMRALAQRFVQLTRNTDEVGRWSEDGFVLVLHNAAPTQAQVVLARLQKAVAAMSFEGAPQVGITLGVSAWEETDRCAEDAVARALRGA